jgi:hypothetical protein
MMPSDYVAHDGSRTEFDLDAVVDVIGAYSKRREGWTALLIYVPATRAFVELRSSPQDVRGNSADEAEEVDTQYIGEAFGLVPSQLDSIIAKPKAWRFIERRQQVRA